MDDETLLRIVKEASSMGVSKITFSGGGEPSLKFDLLIKASGIVKRFS